MTFNNIPDPRNIELPKVKSLDQLVAEAKKDDRAAVLARVNPIVEAKALQEKQLEEKVTNLLTTQLSQRDQDKKDREDRRAAAKKAKNNGSNILEREINPEKLAGVVITEAKGSDFVAGSGGRTKKPDGTKNRKNK